MKMALEVSPQVKNLVAEHTMPPERPQMLLFRRDGRRARNVEHKVHGRRPSDPERRLRVGDPSTGSGRTDGCVAHHGRMPSSRAAL